MRVLRLVGLASILVASVVSCTYIVSQRNESAQRPQAPQAPQRSSARLDIGLPTSNQFLFVAGRENDFYQPIEESRPQSGKYGCVRIGRSGEDGSGFHEGIDIRPLQRDRRGEPLDPVIAISDGTVAYVNPNGGASNYGVYVVVKHNWGGAELYSLYAHLSSVASGIQAGAPVSKGQQLGIMGRTSTDFKIGLMPIERAHVHLEICVLAIPNFHTWSFQRNKRQIEHGIFNGGNLIGLDPTPFLIAARNDASFSVERFLAAQPTAFTVVFRAQPRFPLLEQNPWLLQSSRQKPVVNAVNFYEVAFDHTGFPLRISPRSENELTQPQLQALSRQRWLLSGINEAELARQNCRGLVRQDGGRRMLSQKGSDFMEMLSFAQ